MATKGVIIERILKKLEGGTISTRGRVTRAEVAAEVSGVLNTLFKRQVVEVNFGEDESIPEGMLIALYENIPIHRRDRGRCYAKLPAAPIMLTRDMGVFSVYPSGYPEREFIPIKTGFINLLNTDNVLSPLGPSTYSVQGDSVVLHHDAIGAGVTELDVLLCVLDLGKYGDYDPLPIPADMETECIVQVCRIFGIEAPIEKAESKRPSPTKSDVT